MSYERMFILIIHLLNHDFRALKGFADEYLFLVEPMLRMDKLTEREFHALLVLSFCDNGKSRNIQWYKYKLSFQ